VELGEGAEPPALAGVGLMTEGAGQVLVPPTLRCPTGGRAVLLCPSLMLSHSHGGQMPAGTWRRAGGRWCPCGWEPGSKQGPGASTFPATNDPAAAVCAAGGFISVQPRCPRRTRLLLPLSLARRVWYQVGDVCSAVPVSSCLGKQC